MEFRKKMKNFFTLTRRANGGFTLVELIVVIAILAILAGVGIPVYSGYITKANKQADITLASDIVNALSVYYYSKPGYEGTSSVILSANGATAGGDTTYASEAMAAAFGANWNAAGNLGIKYDKWGNGAAIANEVLTYFTSTSGEVGKVFDGTYKPSFAADIDDLFVMVKDTALLVNNAVGGASGAQLVANAAGLTTSIASKTDGSGNTIPSEEVFASAWAKNDVWDNSLFMSGTGKDYGSDAGGLTGAALSAAIANAGVIKARNTALAGYLRDAGFDKMYNFIVNFNFENSSVPVDVYAALYGDLNKYGAETDLFFAEFDQHYTGTEADEFFEALELYFEGGQAYKDGLAYYAMMSTVNTVKDSDHIDMDDDSTAWDDLSSAVSLYGAIANGDASLANLQASLASAPANSVVITFMAKDDGYSIIVSPSTVISE